MKNGLFLVICVIGVTALLTTTARGDDFAPPPWVRGDPLTTAAEWEFTVPGFGPHVPDGFTVATIVGDSGGIPTASIFGGGAGSFPTWGPGDGDGEWLAAGTTPMFIDFDIPNWIDLEPVKFLRIQVTFSGPTPLIAAISAFDPSVGSVIIVPTGTTLHSPGHILFEYSLFPNPDIETFALEVPAGGSVDQVVVDTISIPEPATMSLLGLSGLALLRRRRR